MEEMPEMEVVAWGIGTAVAVLIGVPFVQRLHDEGWDKAVYDYQTALAGILAVVAALLTIKQMRSSDKAAEERHQASLRASTIRLRREIEQMISSLERGWFFCLQDNGWVDSLKSGDFDRAEATMQKLKVSVGRVMAEINSNAVTAAEDLLDQDLHNALHSIRVIFQALSGLNERSRNDVLAAAYQATYGMREMERLRPQYIEWKSKTLAALGERQSV